MRPFTNRSRASILFLALIFMALVAVLALAFARLIPLEANSILRHKQSTQAHYVAEAGVYDAMAFIEHQLKIGAEPTPSGTLTLTGSLSGWSWTSTITADGQTPPYGDQRLRYYTLESVAQDPGGNPRWRVVATVGQETFTRYTRLIDSFPPGYHHLVRAVPFIEGHVHVNDALRVRPVASLWGTTGDPAYNGYVTSATRLPTSPDGVDYVGSETPFDGAGDPIAGRYERLYLGGRAGINTGASRVEMPDSAVGLASAAWGDTVGFPTSTGVYLGLNGAGQIRSGVYIVGAVDSMLLEDDGGGNPRITIDQGGVITTITEAINPGCTACPQGNTAVTGPGGGIYPGLPNGLYYSTGSVLSLQGTNIGPRTIAVDLAADQEIVITGDVLRGDTPVGTRPTGNADVLGLVARTVRISDTIPRSYADPLYLYLSFVAGRKGDPNGGLAVDSYNDSSLGTGTFSVYGAWAVARLAATGNWDSLGNQVSGLGYIQYFDPYIVESPPPFYPGTGRLPIRSWREEALR